MSTSIEDQLRRMFADDAERAPVLLDIPAVTDHAQEARERHRQQRSRHVRLGLGASILAAASVAGLSIALWGPFGDEQSSDPPNAQAPPSAPLRTPSGSTPVEPSPSGSLPDPDFRRCQTSYSADKLDQVSALAFDRTVAEIGVAPSEPTGDEAGYVAVTFEVNEWFAGGTGTTATVDMFPPDVLAFEATPPTYQTGTRLLVSGNPRSGRAPSDQAVAEGAASRATTARRPRKRVCRLALISTLTALPTAVVRRTTDARYAARLWRVKVVMASSPGRVGGPNEDFVGAVPGAVVLLDGAGIPGTESICRHGVTWYAHTLGVTLLGQLSRDPGTDLVAALADSIGQVSGQHRHTCDIANPSSPQSTVAITRFTEERVDFLVLADVFVVLDSSESGPHVVTDAREVSVRDECSSVLRGLPTGTPEYERRKLPVIDALRARRNQSGGYWIAKDDPHAAMQSVTGSVPVGQLYGAALLSNGASRIVDPYRLAAWPVVLDLLRTSGPDEILRLVREAEAGATDSVADVRPPDDATVAYCEPASEVPATRPTEGQRQSLPPTGRPTLGSPISDENG